MGVVLSVPYASLMISEPRKRRDYSVRGNYGAWVLRLIVSRSFLPSVVVAKAE
jgi:hypothetical protein